MAWGVGRGAGDAEHDPVAGAESPVVVGVPRATACSAEAEVLGYVEADGQQTARDLADDRGQASGWPSPSIPPQRRRPPDRRRATSPSPGARRIRQAGRAGGAAAIVRVIIPSVMGRQLPPLLSGWQLRRPDCAFAGDSWAEPRAAHGHGSFAHERCNSASSRWTERALPVVAGAQDERGRPSLPALVRSPRRSRPHSYDPTVVRGPGVDGISFTVHPGR